MAFKNMQELEQGIAASGQAWSEADKNLAKKNLDYGNRIYQLKNDWLDASKRGDQAGAQRAHDQTEAIRKQYGGYSGGADGSEALWDGTYFQYDDPYEETLGRLADSILSYERYANPYREEMDRVLSDYLHRDPFSYDLEGDPVWQQYQKTYLREGQRAREDTLANYAAATGGQSSTAAMHAASQAQDYYNAQLADKIPELYENAYDRWLDEGEQYGDQLDALRGLGQDALGEWKANRELLNDQFSSVRALSADRYGRAADKWERDYQIRRDGIEDERYTAERAEKREDDSFNRAWRQQQAAYDQALDWLKAGVLPESGVLEDAGLSAGEANRYLDAVLAKSLPKSGSRSSGGSSGRKSSGGSSSGKSAGSTSGGADYAGLFRDAYNSGHPENFIASHYKEYGFTKSTGLTKEYHAAYNDDFEELLDETREMVDASEYSPSAAAAHLRARGYDQETADRVTSALWKR